MANINVDVVIWGSTAMGITAAKYLADRGYTVALIACAWHGPSGNHHGGIMTGGLAGIDWGIGTIPNTRQQAIWGYTAQFLQRLDALYSKPAGTWMTNPEPSKCQTAINEFRSTAGITTYENREITAVFKSGSSGVRVRTLRVNNSQSDDFFASHFMDCSYEGDLLAKGGCSHHIGREAQQVTGEELTVADGFQSFNQVGYGSVVADVAGNTLDSNGQMTWNVGPMAKASRRTGDAAPTIQANNFRLILTTTPAQRLAFTAPAGYNASQYALLGSFLAANPGITKLVGAADATDCLLGGLQLSVTTGGLAIYDCNTNRNLSSNVSGLIARSQGYSTWWGLARAFIEGDTTTRKAIMTEVYRWIAGMLYFVANDASLSGSAIQTQAQTYGYANTEFNTIWFGQQCFPPIMYVREGRRLNGRYRMTAKDCLAGATVPDPVCRFNYIIDLHPATRSPNPANLAQQRIEGAAFPGAFPNGWYQVSYRSMLPAPGQFDNLIVPVCISCTHIAWGALRLELAMMMQAEAAATAIHLCQSEGYTLQTLPYERLAKDLLANGAIF